MAYYLNPFCEDFQGNWVLADRHQSLSLFCPRNAGRGDELIISWENGPFDLSGADVDGNASDTLRIYYTLHVPFERWALLEVDVTTQAAAANAVTHAEVVSSLNADVNFTAWFTASQNPQTHRTQIRANKPGTEFRYYVDLTHAEPSLQFNRRAGVAELPTYFDRHQVLHQFASAAAIDQYKDDSGHLTVTNHLVRLDPYDYTSNPTGSNVHANIIDDAVDERGNTKGFDSATIQGDWQLLRGRSGLFTFQNICLDVNGDIAQIIEYHAGASAGEVGRRICYVRTGGAGSNPIQITEEPYTLTDADLIEPDCTDCP